MLIRGAGTCMLIRGGGDMHVYWEVLTPSSILATANMVEGDTSSSPIAMERSRALEVSFNPSANSQNRSVFAVHRTMT